MTQAKLKRRWNQFSLRQLMLSVACFAVAFSLIRLSSGGIGDDSRLYLWLAAMGIGGGIGALVGRFHNGVAVGCVLGFLVLMARG